MRPDILRESDSRDRIQLYPRRQGSRFKIFGGHSRVWTFRNEFVHWLCFAEQRVGIDPTNSSDVIKIIDNHSNWNSF
jgi:hypothetical protein